MSVVKVTMKEVNEHYESVNKSTKYGSDFKLIEKALKRFPDNTEKEIVAMKIALIDFTNTTRLKQNLGKEDGFDKLAERITQIDFDKRVKKGDLTLVKELSKWTKDNLGSNLCSFISKYCLYHNFYCYNHDHYVIYDSVLRDNLGKYISSDKFKEITGKKLYKNSFKKMIENYEYELYFEVINTIINSNSLKDDKIHRKFDLYIWDKYKPL